MSDEQPLYMHVTIQLVRGKYRLFAATMAEMAPVLEQEGWRLVGAFTSTVGRLGAVFHVWHVPSADGVVTALDKVRSHPDARRWEEAFAESIADEAMQLVRPTSYSRIL
jgi:NIPSNAP